MKKDSKIVSLLDTGMGIFAISESGIVYRYNTNFSDPIDRKDYQFIEIPLLNLARAPKKKTKETKKDKKEKSKKIKNTKKK